MFRNNRKTRWKLLAVIGLVAVGCLAGWEIATWATNRNGVPANAIMVIAPKTALKNLYVKAEPRRR